MRQPYEIHRRDPRIFHTVLCWSAHKKHSDILQNVGMFFMVHPAGSFASFPFPDRALINFLRADVKPLSFKEIAVEFFLAGKVWEYMGFQRQVLAG